MCLFWGGRSLSSPHSLSHCPAVPYRCLPSLIGQQWSNVGMRRRQAGHRDVLIKLQRLCVKALKTHLVVVSGSEERTTFCQEGLLISGPGFCEITVVLSEKVQVRN